MAIYFVLGWFILCFIAASAGGDRKIGYWSVFFIALFFSPIIAIIFAFASKRIEDEEHEKKVEELLTSINESLKK